MDDHRLYQSVLNEVFEQALDEVIAQSNAGGDPSGVLPALLGQLDAGGSIMSRRLRASHARQLREELCAQIQEMHRLTNTAQPGWSLKQAASHFGFLTVEQAAQRIGCSRRYIDDKLAKIKRGELRQPPGLVFKEREPGQPLIWLLEDSLVEKIALLYPGKRRPRAGRPRRFPEEHKWSSNMRWATLPPPRPTWFLSSDGPGLQSIARLCALESWIRAKEVTPA